MYNKSEVTITEMKSGDLGIKTPFNRRFTNELKALVPSAKWQNPYWIIKQSGREQTEELLSKYYPAQEALERVRIEWNLDRDDPQIDGVSLANIERDNWGWKRNCPFDFKVIEQTLESGGSRNNPGLFGRLIIEVSVRPGAIVSPAATVTVLEAGEQVNPLAGFTNEELIAELARRGL